MNDEQFRKKRRSLLSLKSGSESIPKHCFSDWSGAGNGMGSSSHLDTLDSTVSKSKSKAKQLRWAISGICQTGQKPLCQWAFRTRESNVVQIFVVWRLTVKNHLTFSKIITCIMGFLMTFLVSNAVIRTHLDAFCDRIINSGSLRTLVQTKEWAHLIVRSTMDDESVTRPVCLLYATLAVSRFHLPKANQSAWDRRVIWKHFTSHRRPARIFTVCGLFAGDFSVPMHTYIRLSGP
jgi:hypothetical protein